MQNLLSLKTFSEKIRSLDAYPKVLEDFRIKTFGGAAGLLTHLLTVFI